MILIDFSPLKAGGGCQLAINFITSLSNISATKLKIIFLIPDVGPLKDISSLFPQFNYIVSPTSSILKRVWFENNILQKEMSRRGIDKVFTFFGAGVPHDESIRSIVSVAYPIICYNESIFWKFLPLKTYIKQRLINRARIERLKKANLLIVETPVMAERLSNVLKRDISDFKILHPSPSAFVEEGNYKGFQKSKVFKMLFLSGVAPHKNLWRLPEIGTELKKRTEKFEFVISTSQEAFIQHLKSDQKKLYDKVAEHFNFIGTVAPDKINQVYQDVDVLVSLSDLESFSNNYMEAWKAGVPLIVSDRDFSKSICEESALYVEPHKPNEVAKTILGIIDKPSQLERVVLEGKKQVKKLPDPDLKAKQLLELIETF